MSEPDSRLVAAEVCRQVGDNHTADNLEASFRQHPDTYFGEDLCPRCGAGAVSGRRYVICADRRTDGSRWSHQQTCERYTYGDLCRPCDVALEAEVGST